MGIPNVSGALRGWTKKRTIRKIEQTVVDFKATYAITDERRLPVNIQPTPEEQVDRTVEEQRSWTHWTLWIRDGGRRYSVDDVLLIGDTAYKIEKISDWREGGYTEYESVEDYAVEVGEYEGS